MHDATLDVDALRDRVLADLRREVGDDDQQLVSDHHVILDPASVHITRPSRCATTSLA